MIKEYFLKSLYENSFIQATLILQKENIHKITIRPILVKNQKMYQCTFHFKDQVTHKNFSLKEFEFQLDTWPCKEAHLFTTQGDFHFVQTKSKWKVISKKSSKSEFVSSHNREKNYLIPKEGHDLFWKALGVMNVQGEIKGEKQNKFKQVNRFIELFADLLPQLSNRPLKIYDFGCGKGYLTFSLYHYLNHIVNIPSQIIGVDRKETVIQNLERISKELNYQHLHFIAGNIQDLPIDQPVDLVIALHACDTATDEVLTKAISAQAKAIMVAPCCQHALLKYIEQPLFSPLLKHGILKEKFSALVTDAIRATQLEIAGYKTQVIEFIDSEHTPKNIMIRAVKLFPKGEPELQEIYKNFTHFLNLNKILINPF